MTTPSPSDADLRFRLRNRLFAGSLLIAMAFGAVPGASAQDEAGHWYRGNLHSHTNRAKPEVVARWYRDHDYHFVAITDINRRTPIERLNERFSVPGRFLVLGGVETSQELGGTIVDVLGIGVREAVGPQPRGDAAATLTANAAAIRSAGGIPIVGHPNLTWALDADDLSAGSGFVLFELWNAEPGMHNPGGGGVDSTERLWDRVLSSGKRLYGVAVDDAHHFDELGPQWANPGRAWVMVRAAELTQEALLSALEAGDFYATTGVELVSYLADDDGIQLELSDENTQVEWLESGRNPTRYRTIFLGRDGEVLKVDTSLAPGYIPTGGELYVRARVEASTGAVAWTQPVFFDRSPTPD